MCPLLVLALTVPAVILDLAPNRQSLGDSFAPPASTHWFGADQFGRDIFARLVAGGRYSLSLAILIVGLCALTGLLFAGCAILLGGWIETALSLIADAIYALPALLLVLIIAGLFGGSASVLILTLWLASWPEYYRVSLGVLRQVAASDHVMLSRRLGASSGAILRLQIAPSVSPYILALASLSLGRMMLAIAALGFLGVGIAPPQAEWGSMLSELLPYKSRAPVQVATIVAAIFWVVLTSQFLARSIAGHALDAGWCHDRS